jgi:hypothetical protein
MDLLINRYLSQDSRDVLAREIEDDITDVRARSNRMRKLEADALETTDPSEAVRMNSEAEELRKEILSRSDDFIAKTSRLFQLEGIPHTLKKIDSNLLIELDLTQVPRDNNALNFYKRAKKLTGVEKVTISLADNAPKGRAGFFRRKDGRVEIGYKEALNLIEGEMGVTPRHEFRHALFASKEAQDIPSAFQMRFKTVKDGKLLNNKKIYDTYMSAEEIYNWSTDFQTLSKKLRDAKGAIERATIIGDIQNKANKYVHLADTAANVSDDMIRELEKAIKKKKFSIINFVDDQPLVQIQDADKRILELGFFGDERSAIFKEAQAARLKVRNAAVKVIKPELKKLGLTDITSKEYIKKMRELETAYLKSPEARKVLSAYGPLAEKVALDALERLKTLKRIAEVQNKEVKGLKTLLKTYEESKSLDLIESIRAQCKKIGDNVKERYKNSLFNQGT